MDVHMGGEVDEQGRSFRVTPWSRLPPTSIDALVGELGYRPHFHVGSRSGFHTSSVIHFSSVP